MKFAKILIVAFGLMMIAAGTSYGQAAFISSAAPNVLANNAQTGLVGDVALTAITPGTIPNGEIITLSYDVPISSLSEFNAVVNGVAFTGFTAYGAGITNGSVTVTVANQTNITIKFDADTAVVAGPFLQVNDVRVNASGGAPKEIYMFITSVLSSVTVTNPRILVGLTEDAIKLEGPFSVSSSINTAGFGAATATVRVTELFENAFETAGSPYQTQVILRLTNPSTLGLYSASASEGFPLLDISATATTSSTVVIYINQQDQNVEEYFDVTLYFHATQTPVPVDPGEIAVRATLAPPAVGFPPYVVGPTRGYYRFAEKLTPAVLIDFGVGSLETMLLSTFNVVVEENEDLGVVGFNTGFAVANAGIILDPWAGQPGAITVTFYKSDGSPAKSFTTGPNNRPGLGLNNDGLLPVGGTWSVLLPALLEEVNVTGNWQGMIVFHTHFSGAEGVSFIADPNFKVNSQGYQMLVVPWENYIRNMMYYSIY